MNNVLLLFLLLIQHQYFLLAQSPIIQWQKCYGGTNVDGAAKIMTVNSENYTLLGGTQSTDGDVIGNHGASWDPWILNIDTLGNINWQKCFGGSLIDIIFSTSIFSNGNFLLLGTTASNDGDVSGNHNPGTYDAWLIETDSAGNLIRQKCFGGAGSDAFIDLCLVNDSEIVIVGYSNSSDGDLAGIINHGGFDIWTLMLDSSWDIEWQKRFGGSDEDSPQSIVHDSNNNYIIGGVSRSSNGDITAPFGWRDYWVIKLDSIGNLLWNRSYGGSQNDILTSVLKCDSSNYLLCGKVESTDLQVTNNHGTDDIWIVKIDEFGNIIWQKCYGGSRYEIVGAIKQDSDGGYTLVGYSDSPDGDVAGIHTGGCSPYTCADLWMIKIDSLGGLVWQKCLGGTAGEIGDDFIQTQDGGYLVIGEAYSTDGDVSGGWNHGNNDAWVIKLSAANTSINSPNVVIDYSISFIPQSETLNISYSADRTKTVQSVIYDVTGRTIFQSAFPCAIGPNEWHVNVGSLSTGIYIVKLNSEKGVQSKRFVKN